MTARRLDEKAVNSMLAHVLQEHAPDADVVAECGGWLLGGGQPDMIVARPGSERVLIENKYAGRPETALNSQCAGRLGQRWSDTAPVRAVVGLRIPARLASPPLTLEGLRSAADFAWAGWTASDGVQRRLPQEGWIAGGVAELAGFCHRVSAEAADIEALAQTVQEAVAGGAEKLSKNTHVTMQFGKILSQSPGEQTNRMAAAVMLNSAVLQSRIAVHHAASGVLTPAQLLSDGIGQAMVARQWARILEIDYHPVFGVSQSLLREVPDPRLAADVLETLFTAADEVAAAAGSAGLVGRLFGALIADRKFLATFYTLPASAAMLAELAAAMLDRGADWADTDARPAAPAALDADTLDRGVGWADPDAVTRLRIADFACGTGALLTAVYDRITERHRLAGGDTDDIHQGLIERTMIGADIMPAAVHLTAARLSGERPEIDYRHTRTYVMPYGSRELPDGAVETRLGSLDLIAADNAPALWGDGTTAPTATHDETTTADIPRESLDLVIMNPPFTRPTTHESDHADTPNPAFAGLNTTHEDQAAMSKALNALNRRNPSRPRAGHGNAGLASNFLDLAHAKLKPGGVLALVMPAIIVSGKSWRSARELLAAHYSDLTIVSIASDASSTTARAFSADTGMAEALIIARKRRQPSKTASTPARHAVLKERPSSEGWGIEAARALTAAAEGRISIGEDHIGWTIRDRIGADNTGHPAGLKSTDVAVAAAGLAQGRLTLPRCQDTPIPICALGELGHTGPVDRDINGTYRITEPADANVPPEPSADTDPSGANKVKTAARGPFDIHPLTHRATYRQVSWPVLWTHTAMQETSLTVLPCSEGVIRTDPPNAPVEMRRRALRLWKGGYETAAGAERRTVAGATRLHINMKFRVTSQPLGACLTPTPALGGPAWPSLAVAPDDPDHAERWEKALCVWLNTTLGLIARWWVSSRQQQGRALLTVTTVRLIPVLDLRKLTADQTQRMSDLFDSFERRAFLSANRAAADAERQALDAAVLSVLGPPLDSPDLPDALATLREQWCAEPSNQ